MVSGIPGGGTSGPVAALRAETRELHAIAERSGVIAKLLRGRAPRRDYAMLLRNLLPVYEAMESVMRARSGCPGFEVIVDPALFRRAAIESDLRAIAGARWRASLPALPVAKRYASRVLQVARRHGHPWLGHVYTRYLGDLSGGRILKRVLADRLRLPDGALQFYEFPDIGGIDRFKASYLASLGELVDDDQVGVVVREAKIAFLYNIELSEAIAAPAGRRAVPASPGCRF